MRRRTFLAGFGSASLILPLAGCTGSEDGPDEGGDGAGTPTEAEATSEPGTREDDSATSEQGRSVSNEGADPEFVDEVEGQVQLTYGETARLSNGVETTVHGIEMEAGTANYGPEEREVFALVEVESLNGSDGQAPILSHVDPGLSVIYGDRQVAQSFNYGLFDEIDRQPYEVDNEVQAGIRRNGYILFEVGAGLSEADVDFLWQDQWFVAEELDGEIDVRWSA